MTISETLFTVAFVAAFGGAVVWVVVNVAYRAILFCEACDEHLAARRHEAAHQAAEPWLPARDEQWLIDEGFLAPTHHADEREDGDHTWT